MTPFHSLYFFFFIFLSQGKCELLQLQGPFQAIKGPMFLECSLNDLIPQENILPKKSTRKSKQHKMMVPKLPQKSPMYAETNSRILTFLDFRYDWSFRIPSRIFVTRMKRKRDRRRPFLVSMDPWLSLVVSGFKVYRYLTGRDGDILMDHSFSLVVLRFKVSGFHYGKNGEERWEETLSSSDGSLIFLIIVLGFKVHSFHYGKDPDNFRIQSLRFVLLTGRMGKRDAKRPFLLLKDHWFSLVRSFWIQSLQFVLVTGRTGKRDWKRLSLLLMDHWFSLVVLAFKSPQFWEMERSFFYW